MCGHGKEKRAEKEDSEVDERLYISNEQRIVQEKNNNMENDKENCVGNGVVVGGDDTSTVHGKHAGDDDESDVTNLARGDALIRLSTGQVSGSVENV